MPNKDLGTKIIIMELPLADGGKMLFFSRSPVYSHTKLTEEDHSADFYYYNSGTCPTNWLQDLVAVTHIDSQESIDTDPHGIFRLVGILNPGEYEPEMATQSDGSKVVHRIVDADISSRVLMQAEKLVRYLLLPGLNSSLVHDAWLSVLNNKQALYCLSKILYEDDIYFNITMNNDGTYNICRELGMSITVTPKTKEEHDRVKFILEFDVISACNY